MEFLRPKNLKELFEFRKKNPEYNLVAGGTDIVVLMNSDLIRPKGLISIGHIDELKGIKEEKDHVSIGALTTHTELISNELIKKYFPALSEACKTIGARQIQNRGTIGGNVMNASPAGDMLPVLLAYDAVVEVGNSSGTREIDFNNYYKGYRKTDLKNDEAVLSFKLNKTKQGEKSAFIKIGTRKAQAISKIMACFRIRFKNYEVEYVSVAYGSIAATPVRIKSVETLLIGKKLNKTLIEEAVNTFSNEITPIDDIRSTASYRKHVSGVLLKRFLTSNLAS